jgi:hypothetical protein
MECGLRISRLSPRPRCLSRQNSRHGRGQEQGGYAGTVLALAAILLSWVAASLLLKHSGASAILIGRQGLKNRQMDQQICSGLLV